MTESLQGVAQDVTDDAVTAANLAQRNIQRFLELQRTQVAHLIMVAHQEAAIAAAQTAGLAANLAATYTRQAADIQASSQDEPQR